MRGDNEPGILEKLRTRSLFSSYVALERAQRAMALDRRSFMVSSGNLSGASSIPWVGEAGWGAVNTLMATRDKKNLMECMCMYIT